MTIYRKLFCLAVPIALSVATLSADPKPDPAPEHESAPANEAISDLRALHKAMSAYLKDKDGVWPQPPAKALSEKTEWNKYWLKVLAPYGATPKHWHHSGHKKKERVSYIPTSFSAEKNRAYQWEKQPWFVEIDGGVHLIFSDGSATTLAEVMEQQKREGKSVE